MRVFPLLTAIQSGTAVGHATIGVEFPTILCLAGATAGVTGVTNRTTVVSSGITHGFTAFVTGARIVFRIDALTRLGSEVEILARWTDDVRNATLHDVA